MKAGSDVSYQVLVRLIYSIDSSSRCDMPWEATKISVPGNKLFGFGGQNDLDALVNASTFTRSVVGLSVITEPNDFLLNRQGILMLSTTPNDNVLCVDMRVIIP